MGRAIAVRTDYMIDEVRGFAKRSKDAAHTLISRSRAAVRLIPKCRAASLFVPIPR
jgi:hypothetical protein